MTSAADVKERPLVARTISEVRASVSAARRAGRTVGLVPTMGALHAGHLSLVEACRRDGALVVVSIFVNPTQFGPNEDFQSYPRTWEADRRACAEAGVDLIFAPVAEEMYPPGDQTRVRPGSLAEPLCGRFRPGHFEGVCTVVAKLFNTVQPDLAYFGQKDYQQAAVIRRMTADLCLPVTIRVCPIVREPDGLALSSRNVNLKGEDRARALCLHGALCAGRDRLLAGERNPKAIHAAMRAVVEGVQGATVDYLSLVDAETLEEVSAASKRGVLAGAVRIGGVRLIDNLVVDLPGGAA